MADRETHPLSSCKAGIRTRAKSRAEAGAVFQKRDKNQDGAVTLEEFIGNPEGRNVPVLTKRFKQLDGDGDRKLTLEELKKMIGKK